jgi:hypothetical protein
MARGAASGRLEQDFLVILHHGRFQHEYAARLVNLLGTAIGPDEIEKLFAKLFFVAAWFLTQEDQIDLKAPGAEIGVCRAEFLSESKLAGVLKSCEGDRSVTRDAKPP